MGKKYLFALAAALLPLLAGCAEDSVAVPAIWLEIRDARTGAPAAYDATVIVQDGNWADTVRVAERYPPQERGRVVTVLAADNRIGTYDVTITHPEYQTWRREGIRVVKSGDGNPFDGTPLPKQVHIVAELQALSR